MDALLRSEEAAKTVPFSELSLEALAGLTDEQVERYIDLACAVEGVRLLPEFTAVPPAAVPTAEDTITFVVGGIHFVKKEDAVYIAERISQMRRWEAEWIPGKHYSSGTSQYYSEMNEPVKLLEAKVYSKPFYEQRRAIMEQADRDRKHFEEQKREWDALVVKRGEVRGRLWASIEAARGTVNRRSRLRGEFARYLELADCDITIARRFLVKAYPDAQELDPALFSDEPPPLPPRGIRTRPAAVSFEVHNQQGE